MIALTAAAAAVAVAVAVFAVLDQFAPVVAAGAGFGIGFETVGMGGLLGFEGFDDDENYDDEDVSNG